MLGKQLLTTGNTSSILREMGTQILNIFNESFRYVWCYRLVICRAESFLSKNQQNKNKTPKWTFYKPPTATTQIHPSRFENLLWEVPMQHLVQGKKAPRLEDNTIKHRNHTFLPALIIFLNILSSKGILKKNIWFIISSFEHVWLCQGINNENLQA